jgi:hypothetical protein
MAPWWLVALGCAGDGTGPPAETGSTVEPVESGDTGDTGDTGTVGTPSYPQPTSITASCDPTDNALRFTCHVSIRPPQPVQIAFSKADGTGLTRVHRGPLDAPEQDVDLYFLAPATSYTFTASAADWPRDPVVTGSFQTGSPPLDLTARLSVSGTSSTPYLGTNLSCGSGANAAVFDTETGELLWYQVMDPQGAFGGYQMVQFTEDQTVLGQTGGQVVEVDLMGRDLLRKYEGADYDVDLHHDLFKRDGLYYLLYHEGSPLLDGFLIWDSTGTEIARWWSDDHLAIPGWATGDWLHTNTIFVKDGSVWLSSFAQSTVMKVDADLASPTFGQVEWVMAGTDLQDLGNDFAIDWSAVGDPDAFEHQHHLNVLDDGRVMFLDNQHGRGLILDLDEASHTAAVEGAYPTTFPACGPQGTATETAAGDVLVDCSGMTLLEYAESGGAPVWSAELRCSNGNVGGGPSNSPERWYPLDGW